MWCDLALESFDPIWSKRSLEIINLFQSSPLSDRFIRLGSTGDWTNIRSSPPPPLLLSYNLGNFGTALHQFLPIIFRTSHPFHPFHPSISSISSIQSSFHPFISPFISPPMIPSWHLLLARWHIHKVYIVRTYKINYCILQYLRTALLLIFQTIWILDPYGV